MGRSERSVVAYAGGIRLLATAVGVLFGIVLVRLGSPEIKGYASAFMASNSVLFAVANWDVPQGLLRYRRSQSVSGPGLLSELSRVWAVYITLGVFSGAVCIALGLDLWVVVGALAFGLVTQTGGLLNGFRGPLILAFSALVQQVALVVVVVVVSLLGKLDSPTWIMTGVILAYLAAATFNTYFLRAEWAGASDGKRVSLVKLFRGGATWQPTRIGQAALQRLDVVIVAGLLGVAGAGFYSVAIALAGLATTLSVQYSHQIIHDAMSGEGVDLKRTLRSSLLSGIVAWFVLAAVGWPALVFVYGRAFSVAYVPMLIVALGAIALVLAKTITNYDRLSRGATRSNIAYSLGAVVMVASLFFMVPRFELVGASMAYVIGTGVVLSVTVAGRGGTLRDKAET